MPRVSKIAPPWAASWWATMTTVRAASGSPASPTTFHVRRRGKNARRNQRERWSRSSTSVANAAAASSRPAVRPSAAPASASALSSPSGHQNVPCARSTSIRASTPSSRKDAAIHSAATRSPSDAEGRSIAARCRRASSMRSRSGCTRAEPYVIFRRHGQRPRLPVLQDRRRRDRGDARRRGRAHRRVHGHQPGDARPRARRPARAHARPAEHRRRRAGRGRQRRQAPRRARQGAPRRRRDQPAQLVRVGRLADRLSLPRPRHPALRRRPAAAALGSRAGRPGRDPGRGARAHRGVTDGPVRLERDGALAVLTLDSPPLNLFDRAMFDGLAEAVGALERDAARGLLIRAEGRAVSGGVDVHVFDGLSPADANRLWTELLELIHRVEALPFPTVFAAHALTLTAAFELSLGCDLLCAAESARFALVERVVGLTPAMGGTQRMAERAGPARAREFVMTGELFDAATLERWNVVNRVLPDDELHEKGMRFAERLASGPTKAHA